MERGRLGLVAQQALAEALEGEGFPSVHIPESGERIRL
jgi:hypothetical protein